MQSIKTSEKTRLSSGEFDSIRYWCQDETRLGLKTIEKRKITLQGVKPLGLVQWERQAYYLYGVIEPLKGESFFYEFSHLDTECFGRFLNQFSQAFPQDLHIIQLDNGSFNKAKHLQIPNNIILLFQPPNCPELNPIERLWGYIKRQLPWQLFDNLNELKTRVVKILEALTVDVITSLAAWDYIIQAISVAGI